MNKEQTKQIKSLLNKYEVRGTVMRSDESLIEFTNKLMEISGGKQELSHKDILETIEAISRATWSEKTNNVIEDKLIKYLEMLEFHIIYCCQLIIITMKEEQKDITAYESTQIEKMLQEIKSTVDLHDNFFYSRDQRQRLRDMIEGIKNICEFIEDYAELNKSIDN